MLHEATAVPPGTSVRVIVTESPEQTDVADAVRFAPFTHSCANVSLLENKDARKKIPARTFILEELFLTE